MIVLEEQAVPLEGENPAGENLEYDPLYLEMDSLAAAVPDSQMGESWIEGRGPDWKKLRENCISLWAKTRDLRVASYLAVAETATGGLEDCLGAFKLILFLIRDMWESMYPRLDPDDGLDPTERLNILTMLSPEPGAFNDPIMFISKFRAMRLVPALPYTLRDHLVSVNEFEAAGGQSIDPNLITGELMRMPLADIEKQVALAQELKETLEAIVAAAGEKLSAGYGLSMDSLTQELNKLRKFYTQFLQSAPASGGTDAGAAGEQDCGAALNGAGGSPLGQPFNLSVYRPANRADALLLLRKGAEYFQREEPNSPIPLLINRALRFSEMSFIDLLEDIVPDALSRGKDILGIKEQAP
jgi:type VI secretion system ImpA family protein